ncbi:helix-turn-helix transcriptional regulator [Streptomyces sp. PSKA54]|uniref:Helix-turn-helix transcriptional regulator n=1 Tax=Streptomyces himalayensis subsp. aureolus TaxID=2758039 RepID=A0A7W2D704_9ACTN|nr:helix-turn-helix transcriptional regulator [Streptomyces himalayensis]MBA4865954.1 helix-turn-helix transcriptional regulator [Streptomyces himalayensis subsp. aureolus]
MTQPLTPCQIRVIAGLARGHLAARIGQDLGISPRTVHNHILRAAARAGLHGRPQPQLVDYAYRHGYLADLAPEQRAPIFALSARLAQTLDCLARGLSVNGIADELGVGRDTAHEYRRRLYRLLQARTRAHAVALGWQMELLGRARPVPARVGRAAA